MLGVSFYNPMVLGSNLSRGIFCIFCNFVLLLLVYVSSRRPLCIFRSKLIIKALGYSSETPYDQAGSGVNFNVGNTYTHEIGVKIVKLRSVT